MEGGGNPVKAIQAREMEGRGEEVTPERPYQCERFQEYVIAF